MSFSCISIFTHILNLNYGYYALYAAEDCKTFHISRYFDFPQTFGCNSVDISIYVESFIAIKYFNGINMLFILNTIAIIPIDSCRISAQRNMQPDSTDFLVMSAEFINTAHGFYLRLHILIFVFRELS